MIINIIIGKITSMKLVDLTFMDTTKPNSCINTTIYNKRYEFYKKIEHVNDNRSFKNT